MREKITHIIKSIIDDNIDLFYKNKLDLRSVSSFLASKISTDFVAGNYSTAVKYQDEIIELRCMSDGLFRTKRHNLIIDLPIELPYFNVSFIRKLKKDAYTHIPKTRNNNTVILIQFLKNYENEIEVIFGYVLPKAKDTKEIQSLKKYLSAEITRPKQSKILNMKISAKKIYISDDESEKNRLLFWSLEGKDFSEYL